MFRELLCLVAVLGSCDGFATSRKYAQLLDIFKDTKFHDTQMSTALCLTQYEFLRRNFGFAPPKPAMYDKCPYYEWSQAGGPRLGSAFDWIHLETIKNIFENAISDPDISGATVPTNHFDMESYIATTNKQLLISRQNLITALKDADPNFDSIRWTLGRMLHTLQDFYSNTNWIELGNNGVNPNVGMSENLGIAINTGTACKPCAHSFTSSEQQDIDNAYGSASDAGALNELGKKANIYSCTDNVVTTLLTSGYKADEASFTGGVLPTGKCSSGGVHDNFATQTPTGGINKDTDTVIFSPHYQLHQKAASIAVEATIDYLEQLRISLDNEVVFGKLLGFDAISTMSIMIDTTGSMSGSIAAVKAFAQNMTHNAANTTSKFYLTPFNDPEWGPVLSFTDPAKMEAYIGTLTASGGGDTPEKCFAALLDTVRAVPQGTNIYIFTDANSKDMDLFPTIIDIANGKGLHINFMMSGESIGFKNDRSDANKGIGVGAQGLALQKSKELSLFDAVKSQNLGPKLPQFEKSPESPDANSPGTSTIEDYRKMAMVTDGQYILSLSGEISNAANIMVSTNWQTLNILTDVVSPINSSIFVDSTITQVEVSFSVSTASGPLYGLKATITDAKGVTVMNSGNLVLDNTYAMVYRVNITGTIASPWTLSTTGSNRIDQITIRAQSSLTTNLMLIDSKSQVPLNGLPLAHRPYDVYVICDDCKTISTVAILPCGSTSPTTIPQSPIKAGSMNWWSVRNITLPSSSEDNLICVTFTGTVRNSTFKRTAQQKLSVSAWQVNAELIPSSGQVFPNEWANISFSVTNLGPADSYTVTLTSSVGFPLSFRKNMTYVGANQTVNDFAQVQAAGAIGSISTVELTITSATNPSQYATADFTLFIVDPNPDTTPPNCTIRATSVSRCPTDTSLCDTVNYYANLTFYDIGTGVSRVNYNDGTWIISDQSLFNTSNAANHTFEAWGTISCCNNTEFDVIDGVGLVGSCDIAVPQESPATTLSPPNATYGHCYGIVFAGEMSKYITLQQKQNFYNLVLQIVKNVRVTNLKYGIITFGRIIEHDLVFQGYDDFVKTVNGLISDLPNPDSSTTYVQMVLDDILDAIQSKAGQRVTTLFMGEAEGILDPNAGHTASVQIAATRSNVYVLDYSKGIIPMTLWPYLTGQHLERIVNGTGKSVDDLYNAFSTNMVYELNMGLC